MEENKENMKNEKKGIRPWVFFPSAGLMLATVIFGLVNVEKLTEVSAAFFGWSLTSFGWLYQLISIVALIAVALVTFSKIGNVRLGGKDAKPKYSFMTWFAMALTGGIATGIITWGVNEPIIYLSNAYGELDAIGMAPFTDQTAISALARCFYNWTFIPYAMYAVSGLAAGYMCFNRKEKFSVSATLVPLFGKKITNSKAANLIDTLSILAIAIGMSSGLGFGIALLISGLDVTYGMSTDPFMWIVVGGAITAIFTTASYVGLDKGIKFLANLNGKIFYCLLIFLFVMGFFTYGKETGIPYVDTSTSLYVLNTGVAAIGEWLNNFWAWGLDPGSVGGEPLVKWWTMFDWAVWIAYAPLMGLFLGMLSYGRTIREFMIVNWIMPAMFGLLWFMVWGGTALHWQLTGKLDIAATIAESGAIAGVWLFLQNLPLGIGFIMIPIVMVTLVISFSTAADAITSTISALCMKDTPVDGEAPGSMKIFWGVIIGSVAIIFGAFGGGMQGVDGLKYLATVGGFVILFVFILQVISFIKMFFVDKIEE